MSNKSHRATLEEYSKTAEILYSNSDQICFEWFIASRCGWDDIKFSDLYSKYVKSTQKIISSRDNATKIKGQPLESISHFFLKEGGFAVNIRELNNPGKWQVDGQGILSRGTISKCFGEIFCDKFGPQFYLEAKNYINPISNDLFALHSDRMANHFCNVGICFSTSGYKINNGKGIAETIYFKVHRNIFHFLLSFHSIYLVAVKNIPPIIVLNQVLNYALNNQFSFDRDVQRLFSKSFNNNLASEEFQRIFK